MKKVGAILVSLLSVVLLVACSQQSASKKSPASSSQTTTSSEVKKTDASSSEVKEKEKKEEKKEVKKMDLEAIANGDYSSIAGVWQDDKGNKLVFNDKGLVSQELEGYGASLTDYGTASEGIYGGRDGGFLLEYIPAGVTIGDRSMIKDKSSLKIHQMPLKTAYGLVLVSLVLGNKARSTIM